jgi:dTDP-4-amino-4,6-dideoxy-D-galactose acyltransferase
MSLIKYLSWDSDFFKIKIGSVCSDNLTDIELFELLLIGKKEGYKLLYVTNSLKEISSPIFKDQFDFTLVDTKVVYEKKIIGFGEAEGCRSFSKFDNRSFLYALALESGQFSRYKIDRHFPAGEFERFYYTWIENSLNGIMADDIFVYEIEGEIVGFITVSYKGTKSNIGLIATSSSYQGKGIGQLLVQYAENKAIENGCKILCVATQQANSKACSFYEKKIGMYLTEQNNIYHLWF